MRSQTVTLRDDIIGIKGLTTRYCYLTSMENYGAAA